MLGRPLAVFIFFFSITFKSIYIALIVVLGQIWFLYGKVQDIIVIWLKF